MSTTDKLKEKARFLRNAAPRQFEEFFEAFRAYASNASETLLQTNENWQLYQGHAQQCRKIMIALEEAKNG